MIKIKLFVVSLLLLVGCGTRNIKPDELPTNGEGVGFIRVNLVGIDEAMIHIFDQGNRSGPHKSRVDIKSGDAVYAVILKPGKYDIGQLTAGQGSHIWKDGSGCPSFEIQSGKNNYIATIVLRISYPDYEIQCINSVETFQEASVLFKERYRVLHDKYSIVNGASLK